MSELILLAGPNGSGKTTLLRKMAAADPAAVLLPTRIPKVKGFTVKEFVSTALYRKGYPWDDAVLDQLRILPLRDRDIATLSDGEFQKACIATALVQRAEKLLLDEPTAFLDVQSRIEVFGLLRSVADGGVPVWFSSHDIHEALQVCDRVIALDAGRQTIMTPDEYGARF